MDSELHGGNVAVVVVVVVVLVVVGGMHMGAGMVVVVVVVVDVVDVVVVRNPQPLLGVGFEAALHCWRNPCHLSWQRFRSRLYPFRMSWQVFPHAACAGEVVPLAPSTSNASPASPAALFFIGVRLVSSWGGLSEGHHRAVARSSAGRQGKTQSVVWFPVVAVLFARLERARYLVAHPDSAP